MTAAGNEVQEPQWHHTFLIDSEYLTGVRRFRHRRRLS